MSYKMESEEIIKILNILIGPTVPVGDTWVDEQRLENLRKLCDVTDWCLDEIAMTSEFYNKPEASTAVIGIKAKEYLTDVKTWVEERISGLW